MTTVTGSSYGAGNPHSSRDFGIFSSVTVLEATATGFEVQLGKGDVMVLSGTGFTYSGSTPSGGTLTSFTVTWGGHEEVSTYSNFSVPFATLWNACITADFATFDSLLFAGDDTFTGKSTVPDYGNDWSGGTGNDTFSMQIASGGDELWGNAGNDTFNFAGGFSATESIDGGSGTDTLNLNGDYSAGVTFAATTLVNVENINVAAGHNYELTLNDATVAAGQTMTVDGSALGASNRLVLDGTYVSSGGAINAKGGAGDDDIELGSGNDTIDGGAGNDALLGNDGNDLIYGGDGDDVIRGGAGTNTLFGGAGNDYIKCAGGNDLVDGGSGVNRIGFNGATIGHGVTVDLTKQGTAQDTTGGILTLSNIQLISGTTYADTLIGDGGDNWIWGQDGNDVMYGGGGNDIIDVGVVGNQTVDGGTGSNTLSFYTDWGYSQDTSGANFDLTVTGPQTWGTGTITATNIQNLVGTNTDDTLGGDAGANTLYGADGSDTLFGGAGDDTLYGDAVLMAWDGTGISGPIVRLDDAPDYGTGNDVLYGGDGNDTLYGGGGNDVLVGGDGNNLIDGGDGDDYIRVNGGNDTITGGNGYDYIRTTGGGTKIVDGGTGANRYGLYDASHGVKVDLNLQGTAQDTTAGIVTLTNIRDISGTAYADTLIGDGGDNWIWGEGGDDVLMGNAGNDFIEVGTSGNVTIDGGTGINTLSFLGDGTNPNGAVLDLSKSAAQVTGYGTLTVANIQNLSGSLMNDTLTGDAGANMMAGDAGDDVIYGGDGNDTIGGDASYIGLDSKANNGLGSQTWQFVEGAKANGCGNDTLYGGAGDDTIYGEGGNDTLYGGTGNDTLYGGDGDDIIDQGANLTAADVIDGGAGNDTLKLDGNYSTELKFAPTTLTNVENIVVAAGNTYYLTLDDANVAAGQTLTVDGTALGTADRLDFSGKSETDGSFTVKGGAGNDYMAGGSGNDTLIGGAGNDTLNGGGGSDVISGGDGDDYVLVGVNGATGTSTVSGGAGYDYIRFFGGTATIDGGDGGNRFGGQGQKGGLTVDLTKQGTSQDTGAGLVTLTNIRDISGSGYKDTLIGDNGDNWIWGQGGNDVLIGNGGNDFFELGNGGFTSVDGGSGIDTLTFFNNGTNPTGATFQLYNHGGQVTGYGTLTVSNIENVAGTMKNDSLDGDAGANVLSGDAGDDTLDGGAGDDTLYGDAWYGATDSTGLGGVVFSYVLGKDGNGEGNDTLIGGDGNDTLYGEGGDDVLVGGDGNDTIYGGDGYDTILAGAGDDVIYADYFSDDTHHNGGDTVDLGTGADTIYYGGGPRLYVSNFSENDRIIAASDYETIVVLAGDYSSGLHLTTTMTTKVPSFTLTPGNSYAITVDAGVFMPRSMKFNGEDLTASDRLFVDCSSDTLTGGNVELILQGGAGGDTLIAGAADDYLAGNDGNDTLDGGAGRDYLDGGAGTDTMILALSPADYYVKPLDDPAHPGAYKVMSLTDTDYVINVENFTFQGTGKTLSLDQFLAQSFNPLCYIASYPDLIAAFGDNAQWGADHYRTNGHAEGRTITFNPLNYIASYSDLVAAFGDDATAGVEHYLKCGYAEGRHVTFDPLKYIASYGDLIRAFGDDATAGVEHYLKCGCAEGRHITFDPLKYIASYDDLIRAFGDNATAGVEHYIKNGFAEGRTVSFDPLAYICSYSDLICAFGDNQTWAVEHYLKNGFAEGRSVSFNALNYIASYGDLVAAFGNNVTAGEEHYIKNGFREGRSVSFDPVAYLISNPDLGACGFTAANAVQHYIHNGYWEGRQPEGAFGTEQTGHALAIGGSVSDTIGTAGDKDWFGVSLTAGQTYTFTLSGADSAGGTLADPFLGLYNDNGLLVASNNDTTGHDSKITFTAAATGSFYLVTSANDTGTGTYKLFGAIGG